MSLLCFKEQERTRINEADVNRLNTEVIPPKYSQFKNTETLKSHAERSLHYMHKISKQAAFTLKKKNTSTQFKPNISQKICYIMSIDQIRLKV